MAHDDVVGDALTDHAAEERVTPGGVFERNRPLLAPDDDYMIWIVVSRGLETPLSPSPGRSAA